MMKKDINKQRKIRYGLFAAAMIMSAGVFAMMTYAQRKILSDFEKKDVYVANADIPRGIVINEDNASQYLVIRSVDAGCVPPSALTDSVCISGLSPVYDIAPGTLLTDNMFTTPDTVRTGMKEPVLAGFKTDDLSRAVSGVLRAGDRIDVYCEDPETGLGNLLCANVYVEKGYDSSRNEITDMSSAMMFNIYLESSQVMDFYDGLRSGSMYVVKRC